MSFQHLLKRFVLEPIDDFLFSQQRIMEGFNINRKVNMEIYKRSDQLWYRALDALYDFEIIDGDNIPSQARVVVCSNHQSLLDPIVFGVALSHPSKRCLNIMSKIELFETPLINSWVRTHFAFPVRRGKHDQISYQRAVELLEQEEMVGMFPEGTLGPGNGTLLKGKTGAVRLSYETDAAILPVGIYGTDKIFGKGAKYPKTSGRITVKIGEKMHYNDIFKGNSEHPAFYKKATRRVMRKIRDLYFDAKNQK